ncbi:MAG: general secretion pathway protein GspK [Candidatus Omnitrophica bacterium]|nr:general secretion pathway protein GspK [Candidatus Omnitrophota bacterium]
MKKKGSILIFTLWVLIILAILSVIVSRRASTDVRLAKYEADSIKGAYFAKAGVMKMLVELTKDNNGYDSLDEDWNRTKDNPKELILKNDIVFYGASDEMARLNLNNCTVDNLKNLGLENIIANNILKYKTAHNKDFEFMEELFLVEGMTLDLYDTVKDFITIYRGDDAKVNINTAGPAVLMAVVGDPVLAQAIVDYRNSGSIFTNASDISMIDGLDPAMFSWESSIFRIWAEAVLAGDADAVKAAEAIVDRTSGKIYHWREH